MPCDDEDLAEHIRRYQLTPALLVERLREDGIDVELMLVDTSEGAQGHEVECVSCHRTARLSLPPPPGKVAICPDCQPGQMA